MRKLKGCQGMIELSNIFGRLRREVLRTLSLPFQFIIRLRLKLDRSDESSNHIILLCKMLKYYYRYLRAVVHQHYDIASHAMNIVLHLFPVYAYPDGILIY